LAQLGRWGRVATNIRSQGTSTQTSVRPAGAHLRVEGLTVEYTQGLHVSRPLDELSFTVDDNQTLVTLGPSGCGKTTLLAVLAGLLKPLSGSVVFDGTDVVGLQGRALLDYRRRSVGVVFQTFNLVPSLTAVENVMAPLVLTGMRTDRARRVAMRLLDEVALADFARHRPGKLSGGQQQRVAFARALVYDPPLVLADEPTAHLDPEQVDTILRLIREMQRPGRLVVVATHDVRFEPLADRVLRMGPLALQASKERG
jgi:putative ABC transport system ATP-binding protein